MCELANKREDSDIRHTDSLTQQPGSPAEPVIQLFQERPALLPVIFKRMFGITFCVLVAVQLLFEPAVIFIDQLFCHGKTTDR